MAYEALAWSNSTPATLDQVDGTQCYNMGIRFALVAAKNAAGVQWRAPTTLAAGAGGGVYAVAIWNLVTGVRVAYQEFTPTAGIYQDIIFTTLGTPTPVALLSGTNYAAVVYTNHYAFRGSAAVASSPSGNVTSDSGIFVAYNGGAAGAPVPTTTTGTLFYVSPLIEVTGTETHTTTGTAAMVATVKASTTTTRTRAAVAAMVATVKASTSTTRARTGTAALVPTAAASDTTTRARTGTAALVALATATDSTTRTRAAAAAVVALATATDTTTRARTGTAPVYVTATNVVVPPEQHTSTGTTSLVPTARSSVTTTRPRAGTAPLAATARASAFATRRTAGTAPVYVTARTYSATSAPGPWLISAPRQGVLTSAPAQTRIVTGTQVVS